MQELGKELDEILDLTELIRDEFTHATLEHGEVSTISQFDRVYTSQHPVNAVDLNASASTIGDVILRTLVSDHLSVLARVGGTQSRFPRSIPRWATKHEDFEQWMQTLTSQFDTTEDPFCRLRDIKEMRSS